MWKLELLFLSVGLLAVNQVEAQCNFINGSSKCVDSNTDLVRTLPGGTACPYGDFTCDNGNCILFSWKCDLADDCGDVSDEVNCSTEPTTTYINCGVDDYFSCGQGYGCIPIHYVCNGRTDCSNKEDEIDCSGNKWTCRERHFRCENGICIPPYKKCDGVTDCEDQSDETDCGAYEPEHLEIWNITSHKMFLKWKRPTSPIGSIDGYVVTAYRPNGKIQSENIIKPEKIRLSGLNPWTRYDITVRAFKVVEDNTFNGKVASVSGKTRPSEPGAPQDVKVLKTVAGDTYLKWKPPTTPNGEINGYYVKNLNDQSEVVLPGFILKHHLMDLIPNTNYTFSVYAYNLDGEVRLNGIATNVSYTTKPEEPSVVEMVALMRTDMISEFSKQQALMRSMLRHFEEKSDARNENKP